MSIGLEEIAEITEITEITNSQARRFTVATEAPDTFAKPILYHM